MSREGLTRPRPEVDSRLRWRRHWLRLRCQVTELAKATPTPSAGWLSPLPPSLLNQPPSATARLWAELGPRVEGILKFQTHTASLALLRLFSRQPVRVINNLSLVLLKDAAIKPETDLRQEFRHGVASEELFFCGLSGNVFSLASPPPVLWHLLRRVHKYTE